MSEELAVPVSNYRVKISVILTVVKILFSLQNGKRIGTRRYLKRVSGSFPAFGGKFPPDGGKVVVFDGGQNNCYFDSAVKNTNTPQSYSAGVVHHTVCRPVFIIKYMKLWILQNCYGVRGGCSLHLHVSDCLSAILFLTNIYFSSCQVQLVDRLERIYFVAQEQYFYLVWTFHSLN